tara:strand:+ start:455 stop:1060 length:606 start_codon:yes stop_codon:yes gene_type:complete
MANPSYIVDGVLTDGEAIHALGSSTVGSGGVASVTFTSSFSTLTDKLLDWTQYQYLILVCSYQFGYNGANWGPVKVQPNSDSTSGDYSATIAMQMATAGTAAGVDTVDAGYSGYGPSDASGTSNYFGALVGILYDPGGGKFSSWQWQNAGAGYATGYCTSGALNYNDMTSGVWSLKIEGSGQNWAEHSHFDLYGVLPRMVN